MKAITLSAHFDGKRIIIDEDHPLKPNTRLLVTILPNPEESDPGRFEEDWHEITGAGLANAYGPEEPEYPDALIQEPNADYGKR